MKPLVIIFWILVALGLASVVQASGPYVTGAAVALALFLVSKRKPGAG